MSTLNVEQKLLVWRNGVSCTPASSRAMLSLKAYAKINLTLEVLGRRPDGYHEVLSILQTVDLWDALSFEEDESLSLVCDDSGLQTPDNLVLQAAELLRRESGVSKGARIRLEKGIPVAAGLGGGSSDAATTLNGLCSLWGLSMATEDLVALAAKIGSDVPFFLQGGTALVQGRGEQIRPLPPAGIDWLVIVNPGIQLYEKTATLYSLLTAGDFTKGLLTHKLAGRIRGGSDVPPQLLFNVFEEVATKAFPDLVTYRNTFQSAGATEVHLSGSGPCMFALMPRREIGSAIQLLLQHSYGMEAFLVGSYTPSQEQDGE